MHNTNIHLINLIKIILIGLWSFVIYYFVEPSVWTIIICVLLLIVSELVQTIVHELGHLIGGLFSRYHFFLLRLGPLDIYKKQWESKLVASFTGKRFYTQCIMIPNAENETHFIAYNLSGILFNVLITGISLHSAFFLLDKMPFGFVFAVSLGVMGLNKVIANTILCKNADIPNDMTIIVWLSSSRKTKADYFSYLQVYEKIAYGFGFDPILAKTDFAQKDIDCYTPFFAAALSALVDDPSR